MTAADALERADRRAFLLRRVVAGAEALLIVAAFVLTFVSGVISGEQHERAHAAIATTAPSVAKRVSSFATSRDVKKQEMPVRASAHRTHTRAKTHVVVRTVTRVDMVVLTLSLPELHVMRATLAIEPIALRAVAAPLPSSHSP